MYRSSVPLVEQVAGDVVEPDALAQVMEVASSRSRGRLPPPGGRPPGSVADMTVVPIL
ncbi:MAG: hypothetical protein MZV64_05005 [Ignavibacteriales bacterium]|nr:hypothetical protein [Ignavibacteriales bacterium]